MRMVVAVALIYGLLVLLGGIMGYVQAQSLPSLISGLVFGVALLASSWGLWRGSGAAGYWAVGLTLLLALFFGYRFFTTGKWMPAGGMLMLSLAALILLLVGLRR